jgi:glycine rich protein
LHRKLRPLLAGVVILALAILAWIAPAQPASAATNTFGFTGGEQTFTVPAGVKSLRVVAVGAKGGKGSDVDNRIGAPGGVGDRVEAVLKVTPGQVLFIEVGGTGVDAPSFKSGRGFYGGAFNGGGFNGGGSANRGNYSTGGGGGGGATDIRTCARLARSCAGRPSSLRSRLLVAGGAGGGGDEGRGYQPTGGEGGDAGKTGRPGSSPGCAPGATPAGATPGQGGGAGTAARGGAGGLAGSGGAPAGNPGTFGQGGAAGSGGSNSQYSQAGGGGGGGYYGGGAGGGASGCFAGGGGGGSSFADFSKASGVTVATDTTGMPSVTVTEGTTNVLPAISRPTLSNKTFAAEESGPSAYTVKRKARLGTEVSFKLNEAAKVRFTVTRRAKGRKVKHGKKTVCAKPTRKNHKRKRCARAVTLKGSFSRNGVAGKNSFHFTGRLNGRKLKPGRYRLVATPSAGGKRGKPTSSGFRIIR